MVLVGAGSFVFGPSVLHDLVVGQRWADCELVLVDVDEHVLGLMAGVARRMAADQGVALQVSATTRRADALTGADFVFCCAARQIWQRFGVDVAIIDRHVPGHLVTEFGGVAGISYSLRQLGLMDELIRDMQARCPHAWLFSVSNPLPRLIRSACDQGVKAVGFCSAMLGGQGTLWRLFGGNDIAYPYREAAERWTFVSGGTNHFAWLLELRDRATGADAMPDLRARLAAGAGAGQPLLEALARETGWLLMPGDEHVRDFLPPRPITPRGREVAHGDAAERERRLALLRDVGEGRVPALELVRHPSWEKPVDLAAAMALGRECDFPALNLPNRGQVPALPAGAIVETPARGTRQGPVPTAVHLPTAVVPLCQSTIAVTDAIVQAWHERSLKALRNAVELDPTIVPADKAAAWDALQECLLAHADVLPRFG